LVFFASQQYETTHLAGNSKYRDYSDQQLLEKFYSSGHNEWLGILLDRYTLLLYGVCMKYLKNENEAKDSVQQIFLKSIGELHKYEVTYFKSWIYMIAKNHCLMQLRSRPGKYTDSIEDKISIRAEEEDTGALRQKEVTLDLMEAALQELSSEQKLCVTLFYLQKKSYQQITEETGFTYMQVKSYIQNGKRNLKLLVEEKMKPRPSA
jgi:RNA polymerase sigma factor (sigma-70 family)